MYSMRAWILSVALAIAVLVGLPTGPTFAAPSPTATATQPPASKAQPSATATQPPATATQPPLVVTQPPASKAQPSPTPTAALATATRVPPTATPAPAKPSATATQASAARAQTPPAQSAGTPQTTGSTQANGAPTQANGASPANSATNPPPATQSPQGTQTPAATPTASPTAAAGLATGVIHGSAFADSDASGHPGPNKPGLSQIEVTLGSATGLARSVLTDDTGAFTFDALSPGTYRVSVSVPAEYVPTTDAGQDVEVVSDTDSDDVLFGLISKQAAGLNADGSEMDDEQIIALASVSSLPLRFAQGRDLMAQVGRRVLGDGLVWLGVPFRSQIDGGDFQYVNCGPASLTMVLAGFGLEVGPSQVRDYLNNLIDNFDTDLGTSLDSLSRIGKQAGLTPMDLYSDGGGYRNWSTDAVRWHVQQGHPVITLVKYRLLPGHSRSVSEFDHYIVITGLTPNGFIYNDGAFATTLGYGLEISDVELEYAWDNSSIPHHALALGLDPEKKSLSFPELPRKPRAVAADEVAPARGARRLAQADEAQRTPLLLTPILPAAATAAVSPAGPLVDASDTWQTDPDFDVQPTDPGSPMGLNMEQTDQPTLEARPGPGTLVPKLLTLIGAGWLLWIVWSFSGRLVWTTSARLSAWQWRWRWPALRPLRATIASMLGVLRSLS
jgi:hypothetical protein